MIIFIMGVIQITLLNILLSFDNMSIVALSTKDFPKKIANKITTTSILISSIIKIVSVSILMSILLVEWLPIRLVGGILLIKITWDLVKSSTVVESSTEPISKDSSKQYGKAVLYTIIADLSMSLENILAVAAFAHGDRILMILGIIFSIPILLFGSQFIAQLMKKYNIILYVGASSLAYTAAAMILEDTLLVDYIPDFLSQGVSILFAIGIFLYGIYNIHKSTQSKSTAEAE